MSETTTAPAASGSDTSASSAGSLESQLAALKQEKSQLEQKLAEANTNAHSGAIRTARERVIGDFKKNGIEPVLSADGEVDVKATIAKVNKQTDPEKDDLKAQVTAMGQTLDGLKKSLERAESEKSDKIVEVELSKAFGEMNVIDQNDAIALFRANFGIKVIEGGAVRVYKGDAMQMNAQNQPATVKEMAEVFLRGKAHLIKPTARSGERSNPHQITAITQDANGIYRPTAEQLDELTGKKKRK